MSHSSSTLYVFLNPFPISSIISPKYGPMTGLSPFHIPSKPRKSARISCSGGDNQLNLSVLRFTLGIPGFDESYLPRWIGYAFGSLLLLNHFVGSNSSAMTPAQLRTEVLGLSLAAFSVMLPYIGQFLKGATPVLKVSIPEGVEQIFAMSPNVSDAMKEDLAWGSYTLLRNTNSISVLISMRDAMCVRGYWKTPKSIDFSKDQAVDWFKEHTQRIGLFNLAEPLYLPQRTDSELWEILPEGTRCLLVLPVVEALDRDKSSKYNRIMGFVLLASSIDYAYTNKDRAWISAIAKKFEG